ncbi:MAG: caa(3)-type oxidase, subunit [Bacteroidetes bacterium]|jgi:cytochrome c oxidase subunit 4|nr:caa(3)-type oxidase, subunit [Bacteroidota bacterium]
MSNHILPKKTYYMIGAALMMLLAVTVGVALLHLGPFNVLVALGVAVTKAVLVVLYFMHVKYNSRLTWVFASGGVLWLLIMLILTMGDFLARY